MFYKIAGIAWTLGAIILCVVPSAWLAWLPTNVPVGADKLVHVGLFAGFGLFWTLACSTRHGWYRILWVGIVLALVTEIIQGAPGLHRQSDIWDGVADVVGLVAAIQIAARVNRYRYPCD